MDEGEVGEGGNRGQRRSGDLLPSSVPVHSSRFVRHKPESEPPTPPLPQTPGRLKPTRPRISRMLSLLLLSHSTEHSGSRVSESEAVSDFLLRPEEVVEEVEVERDTPRAPAMTACSPVQQVLARALGP